MTTFEEFDPNKLAPDAPLWGVYDGYRFKTYQGSGPAAQGFRVHTKAKLYSFHDGRWNLITQMLGGRKSRCDRCGTPIQDDDKVYSYAGGNSDYVWRKNWGWLRDGNGGIVKPHQILFACRGCIRSGAVR